MNSTKTTNTAKNETVLFKASFESGLGIYRNGIRVAIVPECTYWDDDAFRVIDRDGECILQMWGTDEWSDVRSIGPVAGLTVSGRDEDGEHDVFICSTEPLK